MVNPFHKFPSGRGASSSISSFETGCMNRTLRACRQMLPSGLERGRTIFQIALDRTSHFCQLTTDLMMPSGFLNQLRVRSNFPNDQSTGNARSLSCCSAPPCRMHNFLFCFSLRTRKCTNSPSGSFGAFFTTAQ